MKKKSVALKAIGDFDLLTSLFWSNTFQPNWRSDQHDVSPKIVLPAHIPPQSTLYLHDQHNIFALKSRNPLQINEGFIAPVKSVRLCFISPCSPYLQAEIFREPKEFTQITEDFTQHLSLFIGPWELPSTLRAWSLAISSIN